MIAHCNTYGGRTGSIPPAAAAHFLPALNYYSLPVPSDEDPDTTAEHLAALRQAVLAEGELDLLGDGMRRFATDASFAAQRGPLRGIVDSPRSFRFLRVRTRPGKEGPLEEFLCRQAHGSGETFWTMRFADGVLVSLNWEDE